VLLSEANRVVSIEHLIDAIWEDDPPSTARTQVQICVSSLRRDLARIGCAEAVITRMPGYVLQVAFGQLDSQLFAQLSAKADMLSRAGEAAAAAEALRQALGLWRGPTLSGINSRTLTARATQLDEARLTALESCLDLELGLGWHRQVIAEIVTLVAEDPQRERLRGLLMLALYRSGRQAEALDVYRLGRDCSSTSSAWNQARTCAGSRPLSWPTIPRCGSTSRPSPRIGSRPQARARSCRSSCRRHLGLHRQAGLDRGSGEAACRRK
jgi:DNA-binding SARP family transcriptional activator